jgi:hypothetical protein
VPPVEAAPKVAKAPAKTPAKARAAAKPIPPLVDLAGTKSAPAAAEPNPYAPATPAAAQPNPYAPSAPPQYGPPQPYNYGPYVPQPPQGLSIVSMVLGIVGLLLSFAGWGFLLNVAAVITGHMATKRHPYAKGFWLTGIITGYVGLGFTLLWGAFWLIILVLSITAGSSSGIYGY